MTLTPAQHDRDHADIRRLRRLLTIVALSIFANAGTLLVLVLHGHP